MYKLFSLYIAVSLSDYHLSDWNATNTEDDEKWDKGETVTIIALICFVLASYTTSVSSVSN